MQGLSSSATLLVVSAFLAPVAISSPVLMKSSMMKWVLLSSCVCEPQVSGEWKRAVRQGRTLCESSKPSDSISETKASRLVNREVTSAILSSPLQASKCQ